jgi:hypothetical protein
VECGGCETRFWKKAPAPFRRPILPKAKPPLGEPSDKTVRYRLIYSKRGKARYLSHIDLILVLQRSFRRAGVKVRLTQGFHPKMDFSYGPALPLGMEGLREVLEFKSSFCLDARLFLARVNRALPGGIRAIRLGVLDPGSASLADSIEELVYSLDWKGEDFAEAWRESRPEGASSPAGPDEPALRGGLDAYRRGRPEAAGIGVVFKGRRLYFVLPPSPRKGLRAQDVVAEALGIPEPATLLRRDEIRLRTGPPGN